MTLVVATRSNLRRRMAALALALSLTPAVAQTGPDAGAADGPPRHLWVELREVDDAGAPAGRGPTFASADSRGGDARAVATARRAEDAAPLRLRMLNGAEAESYLGRQELRPWLEWAWTPGGPALAGGSEAVELGRALKLRALWPGGGAPVTVTLRSDAVAARDDTPDGSDVRPRPEAELARRGVMTTVRVPLGAWVAIASSGEPPPPSAAGTVSSREAGSARARRLELRVTLAD
jgi:hypothetical protein